MKKIEYCCDRCGKTDPGHSYKNRICVGKRPRRWLHKIRFYCGACRKTPSPYYEEYPDEMDLCDDCRQKLDEFLGVKVK